MPTLFPRPLQLPKITCSGVVEEGPSFTGMDASFIGMSGNILPGWRRQDEYMR